MKQLFHQVLVLLAASAASAIPQGYTSGSSFSSGSHFGGSSSGSHFGGSSSGSHFGGGSSGSHFGGGFSGSHFGGGSSGSHFGGGCSPGQVRHVDGRCVSPRVNRRVFLYDVPANTISTGPPPHIPEPTIDTNIIFIRTPDGVNGPEPIVVPPPQQQHVVYVLNKQSQHDQRVIEVPAGPASNPEVYFVNYADGENPTLPSGVDLQTALNAASHGGGQTIGGGSGFIGGSSGGGFVSGGSSSGGFIGGISSPSSVYTSP